MKCIIITFLQVRQAIESLKNASKADNPLETREAVDRALASLTQEQRTKKPSMSNLNRTYQRSRRNAEEQQGDRGLDANPLQIAIPDQLRPNIFLDEIVRINNEPKRILCFSSDGLIEALRRYPNEISIDGTFKSSPSNFSQLFTIHVVIDFCAIPVIFALLPSKEAECYARVFAELKGHFGPA